MSDEKVLTRQWAAKVFRQKATEAKGMTAARFSDYADMLNTTTHGPDICVRAPCPPCRMVAAVRSSRTVLADFRNVTSEHRRLVTFAWPCEVWPDELRGVLRKSLHTMRTLFRSVPLWRSVVEQAVFGFGIEALDGGTAFSVTLRALCRTNGRLDRKATEARWNELAKKVTETIRVTRTVKVFRNIDLARGARRLCHASPPLLGLIEKLSTDGLRAYVACVREIERVHRFSHRRG